MSEEGLIRVMIVDDHLLFRDGMVSVVRSQPDMRVVGEAGDGLEALVMAQNLRPDVILMDINMPGTDGLEATRLIVQAVPGTHIVMLTVRDENERIFEAIRSGAQGYLLKTIRSQQLLDMIRAAARGEAALTPLIAARMIAEFRRVADLPVVPDQRAEPLHDSAEFDVLTIREQEVLRLIAAGRADKEIAGELAVSLYTVKAHVRSILGKLQVNNRREAARLARRSTT